jgi:hypothetical protein
MHNESFTIGYSEKRGVELKFIPHFHTAYTALKQLDKLEVFCSKCLLD